MEFEELVTTVTKLLNLFEEMEGKEKTDLIEVEVGSIYDSVLFTLTAIVISNKEELKELIKLIEENDVPEANDVINKNDLLNLKAMVNGTKKFEKMQVIVNEAV